MTFRKAFVDSTHGVRVLGISPQPLVWQWWLRVEAAYKRLWPGEEMLEPPTKLPSAISEETIFRRSDGTYGWYDETWNEGDDVHYQTPEEAAKAQKKYAEFLL